MVPLGNDSVYFKTDNVLPSLSVLFEIHNQAVRVILFNIVILKHKEMSVNYMQMVSIHSRATINLMLIILKLVISG